MADQSPLPYWDLSGRTRRAVNAARVRPAEAVTLTSLVPHVTGIKVAFEGGLDGRTLEHLEAVGGISDQEPSVGVGQEVVDAVTFGNQAHGLDRVDGVQR